MRPFQTLGGLAWGVWTNAFLKKTMFGLLVAPTPTSNPLNLAACLRNQMASAVPPLGPQCSPAQPGLAGSLLTGEVPQCAEVKGVHRGWEECGLLLCGAGGAGGLRFWGASFAPCGIVSPLYERFLDLRSLGAGRDLQ